jgi:23S rRNA (cytosine1962-C5)-methyltransferase
VAPEALPVLLEKALAARQPLFDPDHRGAFRLFNGFTEGCPDLVVDLYAATVLLHNYASRPEDGLPQVREAQEFLQAGLPWLRAGMLKTRHAAAEEEKRGQVLFGTPDDRAHEGGVWYSLDLRLHQDASLYLDTRNLRQWAAGNLGGQSVLNSFAYTGSLGVAALAGGARRVIQLDLDRRFLDLAKASYALNGFPVHQADFLVGDFFAHAARLKRSGELFDCVFLDPPFFSATPRGALDLNRDSARLINKLRPLVRDGGLLVAVNNALYVSGRDYLAALEALCADGYLRVAELIPVPEDFTGYVGTRRGVPVTDPAPFNHSTKIAVLEVRRKKEPSDER